MGIERKSSLIRYRYTNNQIDTISISDTSNPADHRSPLHRLSLRADIVDTFLVRMIYPMLPGWKQYNVHDLARYLLGWICTTQILHNISYRQVRIYMT